QAEDGIRDATVTGVQTCALPIYALIAGGRATVAVWQDDSSREYRAYVAAERTALVRAAVPDVRFSPEITIALPRAGQADLTQDRSEERRVGKGGRCRGVVEKGR